MRFVQDPYFVKARAGLCLLGLLALPVLAGCGGGGGGGGSSPTPVPVPNPVPIPVPPPTTPLSASVITPTGLTATLAENSSTVSVGGTVTYTLTLTNSNAASIPIHSNGLGTPSAVVKVIGPSGAVSFAPVPGPAPLGDAMLAPGQSLTTTVTANGFAAAGTYSATGTFSDDITPKYAANVSLTVTAQ